MELAQIALDIPEAIAAIEADDLHGLDYIRRARLTKNNRLVIEFAHEGSMAEKIKLRRRSRRKLIRAYAEQLPGKVLGIFWKEFHELVRGHSGIYVLYKDGIPHYVGKAGNLSWRIRHHQNDRLKGKWDAFSLYVVRGDRYVKDVESLLLRIVKPKGALVSGRFRGAENLKKALLPRLERYADALTELKAR